MKSSRLSGEQLVNAHSKIDYELPSAGVKEFQPSHSWLEGKQIQNALEQRKALLEEERVEKWTSLMKAEWIPHQGMANVKQKSKYWEVYGHHSDTGDWLYPEEVLFLMEMNCLECLFGEVPLSIQKGYSLLLNEKHGCTRIEYQVFAHLCRSGYRVVRHQKEFAVSMLDRLRKENAELCEPETPRPDLPPKKILELPLNSEIVIDSSCIPSNSMDVTDDKSMVHTPVQVSKAVPNAIEVITLEDSSSEESSDDSDIEIIHEYKPTIKTAGTSKDFKEEEEDDDDDDDDVIEILDAPVSNKKIIVATIESSDSDKDASDSSSEKSYDGNFKRIKQKAKKSCFIKPSSMSNFHFLAVDEFCLEKSVNSEETEECVQTMNGNLNEMRDGSNTVEYLSVESSPNGRVRPFFPTQISRNEILDLMPSMAHQNSKIMSLNSPDLRLIPENIIPKQQSYTFNTNSLRARVFSTFRSGFRGRRNFHGSRFNSYNPLYNSINTVYSDQLSVSNPLSQMFGSSDVHSVARGMMQFASALLNNLPQNNQSNSVLPYNPQINSPAPRNFGYSQSRFNSQPSFEEPTRNFTPQSHGRFQNSFPSSNNCVVMNESNYQPFQSNSGRDRSISSRNSLGDSGGEPCERTFTPPTATVRRGHFKPHFRSRRPFGKNHLHRGGRFSPAPPNFRPTNPVSPTVDPAYVKQDIPVPGEPNATIHRKENGNFIPLTTPEMSRTTILKQEVIEILDNENDCIPGRGGVSNRFRRREKRKMRGMMASRAKRQCRRQGPRQNKAPVIVFLDSPVPSSSSVESVPMKQENNDVSSVGIKTESSTIKRETNENFPETVVKREVAVIKPEKDLVKVEESDNVRVKLEQDTSGKNLLVEIKIDSCTNTSPSSLPIASLVKLKPVKSEPNVSTESLVNIKTEPVPHIAGVKSDSCDKEVDTKDGIVQTMEGVQNAPPLIESEKIQANTVTETSNGVLEQNKENNGVDVKESSEISRTENENSEQTSHRDLEQNKENNGIKFKESSAISAIEISSTTQKETCELTSDKELERNTGDKRMELESSTILDSEISRTTQDVTSEPPSNEVSDEMEVEMSEEINDNASNCNAQSERDTGMDNSEIEVEVLGDTRNSKISSVVQTINEIQENIDSGGKVQSIMHHFSVKESDDNCTKNETCKPTSENDLETNTGHDQMELEESSESLLSEPSKTTQNVTGELSNEESVEMEVEVLEEINDNDSTCKTQTGSGTNMANSKKEVEVLSDSRNSEISSTIQANNEIVENNGVCGTVPNTMQSVSELEKDSNHSYDKVCSWADMKKQNFPLASIQESQGDKNSDEEEDDDGDDQDIQPLLKPKHCKTVGTVLSALQIFSPFTPEEPLGGIELEVSFDMYLPSEFHKTIRDLPQYRIIVFDGTAPIPSPCRFRELKNRFPDNVPLLQAVVMPGSVVFYTWSDFSLPVDVTSYRK